MGIVVASTILLAWAFHLVRTLQLQTVDPLDIWFWVKILLQTWLFTGLFITAHDAMHGTVSRHKAVNRTIGFLATILYAGLWYPSLKKKHHLHHKHVATAEDPDYQVGNQNFFVWWFHFMKQYITIWQMLIMAAFFNIGLLFFSEIQLIVFWVVPAILSTFQLFYFGTYRPHRLPHTTAMEPYKARSQKTNHFWALASCYFFGYHYEHHLSPKTPWWELYKTKHT